MNNDEEKSGAEFNLDLLKDIELPLTLRFARTRMPLEKLIRLSTGSVIEFDGSADDPVELLVNGRVIARGEAVIVQNSYGIRITEIATPQERILPAATAIAESAGAETGGKIQ